MIVMKFGGTSVGSAEKIRAVLNIIGREAERAPAVVVSAHAGVTDALLELGAVAPGGEVCTERIESCHREILRDLGLAEDLHDDLFSELRDLVRGMRLVGEASPRAKDSLVSFGERCSARTIAAFLSANGFPAQAVDAFDAGLRTDGNSGRARPLPDEGRIAGYMAGIDGIPVVTGFIAKDVHGNITTLGRNGSDYTAALFGQALGAEEIQIWTDVDGILTADPKIVPDARPIPAMSFDEASELAYYGGRVLHPATILPAIEDAIPVRVLNTSRPDLPGTIILAKFENTSSAVCSIVYKRAINLINLISPRMLQQHGFLAKVFTAAANREIDVDIVATSEVSITMTTASNENLDAFAADLESIGEVSVEPDHAMLCVVGQGIAHEKGVAARVLTTIAESGVRVRVISQGAVKVNVATVIGEADLECAVKALHEAFFG
ncbi:MAG: aspartate kinase [Planctomycetota bacterium]|jgi:aspartate kinase|nr:aspartate kinase [Planctomycetota bacterium]